MPRYGQFCPVAKTLEIVGTRWTPLLLRELLAGSKHFSDLHQGVPLMSRSLLAQRLKELEHAGLLVITEKPKGRGHEYQLTRAGASVRPILEAMADWGVHYAQGHITPEDCDPAMMFLGFKRHGDRDALPDRRFVMRFELRNLPKSRRGITTWWLIWDDGELDFCLTNPGFEVDLVVHAAIDMLVRVWMGDIGLNEATACDAIRFTGEEASRAVFVAMLDLRSVPYPKTFQLVHELETLE